MQRRSLRHSPIMSALVALALPTLGCGPTSAGDYAEQEEPSGGAAGESATDAGTGGSGSGLSFGGSGGTDGGSGGTGGGSGGTDGGKQIQVPVRSLPGLTSMTFFERTGGSMPTPYTFTVDGPELTSRMADPLGKDGYDIPGAPSEYYDVYYSDEDGEVDIDGSYLTISGVYDMTAPLGGGLNLAEIALNFSGKPAEYGNYVASFASSGDNKDDSSVGKCVDGDLQTETTMGNTAGTSTRLRLTLGFLSSSGPPPIK